MEKSLEKYLETMEKCLRPVPVSERTDIVSEIKSEMLDLQSSGVPAESILERLGEPKDLAKAYLGDLLTKEPGWNKVLVAAAFYSLAGLSGMFVFPLLGIIAPSFLLCGVLCPVLGAVKLANVLFRLNIPWTDNVGIQISNVTLTPVTEFVLMVLMGVALVFLGWGAWKLLKLYCKKIAAAAKRLG